MSEEIHNSSEEFTHWTEEMDKLYEQGLINSVQAEIGTQAARAGHAAVSRQIEAAKESTVKKTESNHDTSGYYIYRDGQRTINPNRLSSAELAKGGDYAVPKHVRDQLPYPR